MPDAPQIRAIVEEYLRAGRERDKAAWLELFADDAVLEDPVGGSHVVRGRSELESFFDKTIGSSEGFDNALRDLRIGGNSAAFLFDLFITFEGTRYQLSPIDVQEYDDDGLIVSMKAYWSRADMVTLD